MDTEVGVDQPEKVENLSQKLNVNYVVLEANDDVIQLPPPSTVAAADRAASLGPITPDSNTESGDFLFDFTSPLTLNSSPPIADSFESHLSDIIYASCDVSPRTPTEGVFDPFAPGPEKVMMAPHCNKYLQESRSNAARRLNFDSSVKFIQDENYKTDAETISDDEVLLEAVYDTLLEAIVLKQSEGFLAEILPLGSNSDGFKTPVSATRLNGIAETCPRAPMKPTRKLRNIDQGLCRKLEF